jgi:hypothetical protein
MAATNPAITDSSRLVALLYRADWRQLCLSAEVSTRVNRARVVRPAPGRKSQERADAADRANPRETWRLATETGAEDGTDVADDAGAADDTGAEGQPRWQEGLSRVLIAPGGRCRIENAAPGPDQLVVCDGEKWWRATPDEAIGLRALSRPADYAELLDPSWLISRFDTELIGPAEAAGRPPTGSPPRRGPSRPPAPSTAVARSTGLTSSWTWNSASCCARKPSPTASRPS